MDFPNSEFWNYSSQIWTLPQVEPLCLDLQDHFDINVNVLLYCYWVGEKKLSLNDDDIQTLIDATLPWSTIIAPLRDSRKMMRQNLIAMSSDMINQTISNINEMEINAEHMTQIALEKALKLEQIEHCNLQNQIECSNNNIKKYVDSLDNSSISDEINRRIFDLHNAIFQDIEAVQEATMG